MMVSAVSDIYAGAMMMPQRGRKALALVRKGRGQGRGSYRLGGWTITHAPGGPEQTKWRAVHPEHGERRYHTLADAKADAMREVPASVTMARILLSLTPELLAAVDDWRRVNRAASREVAICQMLEAVADPQILPNRNSSSRISTTRPRPPMP
jgi:hypothetical protein